MEEYIGMIQSFAGDYAPYGYLLCEGQTLSIQQYTTLYAIIGVTYGGDGRTTFKLPDLRGRAIVGGITDLSPTTPAISTGLSNRSASDFGGLEKVKLEKKHIPPHNHGYNAISGNRESKDPKDKFLGATAGSFYARKDAADTLMAMNAEVISPTGEGKEHDNMPPFLCVNYIICVEGEFPPKP